MPRTPSVHTVSGIVGANVRKLRVANRMRQEDVCAAMRLAGINLNPPQLSRIELGANAHQTCTVDVDKLFAFSRVFGVPATTLMNADFNIPA